MITYKPGFRALLLLAACGGGSEFAPNYTPTPVFTNPTNITNAYLPYANLQQDILLGTEGGKAERVVRTRTGATKNFTFNGQQVVTIVVVDSAFLNDTLVEVAKDYFAQSDAGDVYYFGEDVDNYVNGQVANHDGSWLFGVHTNTVGLFLPATPSVGQKFRPEDVPGITTESDEVISVSESVTVPTGSYTNCVKVKEILSDGAVEYKLYAPGVGIVKEISEDGAIDLQSHH
jgi:hypothetical protein